MLGFIFMSLPWVTHDGNGNAMTSFLLWNTSNISTERIFECDLMLWVEILNTLDTLETLDTLDRTEIANKTFSWHSLPNHHIFFLYEFFHCHNSICLIRLNQWHWNLYHSLTDRMLWSSAESCTISLKPTQNLLFGSCPIHGITPSQYKCKLKPLAFYEFASLFVFRLINSWFYSQLIWLRWLQLQPNVWWFPLFRLLLYSTSAK